jgi:hypothetical protein
LTRDLVISTGELIMKEAPLLKIKLGPTTLGRASRKVERAVQELSGEDRNRFLGLSNVWENRSEIGLNKYSGIFQVESPFTDYYLDYCTQQIFMIEAILETYCFVSLTICCLTLDKQYELRSWLYVHISFDLSSKSCMYRGRQCGL